ncbi:MAG: UDP-glucose 4-epimerase GalE [Proteobacteria bacterium]|nr:UDP-glucose 4-epimerase GalE [Pseudomonadota bacterium]
MKILVTGGAGYIGSHMVLALAAAGHEPVIVDSLIKGHRQAVLAGTLCVGDVGDADFLRSVLAAHPVEAVVHFAGFIESGESMQEPARYLENNTAKSFTLLDVLTEAGAPPPVIFSSTAAVYGDATVSPIPETAQWLPKSPYALSKCLVEQALAGAAAARGMRHAVLRYFNAAGADPHGRLGEDHQPETHLIPIALQAAAGRRAGLTIHGADYPTPDGTCVRDYVHVSDLCAAHLLVLQQLLAGYGAGCDDRVFNVGTGHGWSVKQVIDAVCKVTGVDVPVTLGPRRMGDPAVLVADSTRLREVFGWSPAYSDIETMVAHAWAWEQRRPVLESGSGSGHSSAEG